MNVRNDRRKVYKAKSNNCYLILSGGSAYAKVG